MKQVEASDSTRSKRHLRIQFSQNKFLHLNTRFLQETNSLVSAWIFLNISSNVASNVS